MNLLLSYGGYASDPWVERLPRLLEPMGIRSLHAPTARHASDYIQNHQIHVAVVDLGLPMDAAPGSASQEAGPRLLKILAKLDHPPPTLVVKRTRSSRDDQREIAAALRAGAFAVLDRPRDQRDLEIVLGVLRRVLTRHYAGRWPDASAG